MRTFSSLYRTLIVLVWVFLFFRFLLAPEINLGKRHSKDTLTIFTWGGLFRNESIKEFETATGINVNINYYSSNEELLVKLKATKGAGYDLIIPSDYAVSHLIHENLIKPIDKEKIQSFASIYPYLLGHNFDKENRYSIPFTFEVVGIGYDSDYFNDPSYCPSWDEFYREGPFPIASTQDPFELVCFAALYLYGSLETLEEYEREEIKELLSIQRKRLIAYTSRTDYLVATKNCLFAISNSTYMLRSSLEFPFLKFKIPKEGGFISIENFALPKDSEKEDLAYAFINFFMQPQILAEQCNEFYFFPAEKNTLEYLETTQEYKNMAESVGQGREKLLFTRFLMSEENTRKLWVEIKAGK